MVSDIVLSEVGSSSVRVGGPSCVAPVQLRLGEAERGRCSRQPFASGCGGRPKSIAYSVSTACVGGSRVSAHRAVSSPPAPHVSTVSGTTLVARSVGSLNAFVVGKCVDAK